MCFVHLRLPKLLFSSLAIIPGIVPEAAKTLNKYLFNYSENEKLNCFHISPEEFGVFQVMAIKCIWKRVYSLNIQKVCVMQNTYFESSWSQAVLVIGSYYLTPYEIKCGFCKLERSALGNSDFSATSSILWPLSVSSGRTQALIKM